MEVAPRVSTEEVTEVFAEALRGISPARDAWVSAQYDTYDLWLLVDPIDMDEERDLYALEDSLYERFPSAGFFLHVLNPQMFADLRTETIVPAHAYHIGIRASA